jgi:hypothetical protein
MKIAAESYRFSGHETFPCRYAWLPKAYHALRENPRTFADEDSAMITLGVGKNMVRSIRFWAEAAGISRPAGGGTYHVTDFGDEMFAPGGHDPYLEDPRTLWLLHWQLSTATDHPLFAWHFLLNRWSHPEISRQRVLAAFAREAASLGRELSQVTLEQHLDAFLHTYAPTRSRKGAVADDNLDCPLVELELVQRIGERAAAAGGREAIYAFRREDKSDVTGALFAYSVGDYWERSRPGEKTLSFWDVATAVGSPGQIFKLPEADLRRRMEMIGADSAGQFQYHESAALQQLSRTTEVRRRPLGSIFAQGRAYA